VPACHTLTHHTTRKRNRAQSTVARRSRCRRQAASNFELLVGQGHRITPPIPTRQTPPASQPTDSRRARAHGRDEGDGSGGGGAQEGGHRQRDAHRVARLQHGLLVLLQLQPVRPRLRVHVHGDAAVRRRATVGGARGRGGQLLLPWVPQGRQLLVRDVPREHRRHAGPGARARGAQVLRGRQGPEALLP
jgi:hypothetical protein